MKTTDKVLAGNIRAIARLLTALECNAPHGFQELKELYPHTGKAHIVGVTGAPGVGKSTLIDSITRNLRRKGMTIGIIAIDPTSPFTGGALLGDRVRMEKHNTDPGVFIRSLATRGASGGISRAALAMTHVLDAMGKNIIFIETVGIGQSEIDITRITDTSVLILTPGMGDAIQLMKAGILEAADIFVINKADREGAESLRVELQSMMNGKTDRPIFLTEALTDKGTAAVAGGIVKHRRGLVLHGELDRRRRLRAGYELMTAIDASIRDIIDAAMKKEIEKLADDVVARKLDPYSAAGIVFERLGALFKSNV